MKKMNNELTPPRKINPHLSERLDAVIQRAMNSDPQQRPASCREFVEELTGQGKLASPSVEGPTQDLWYLLYKDEEGARHMVKGTLSAIRRSLKDGLLGDAANVRASRTKTGTFEQLRSLREFRDLVAAPATGDAAAKAGAAAAMPGEAGVSKKSSPKQSSSGPHIPLDARKSKSLEWLKLIALLALAMGAGVLLTLLFR